ncbi:hypothetical protein Btru_059836 [Bulinus truncatus]|nr:hypothetical protein Btru_059836 [Bulinus truncatus]
MFQAAVLCALWAMVSASNYRQPKLGEYPCSYNDEGTTFAIKAVCFAYFQCENGEARYHECPEYSRFDTKSKSCVYDASCVTACPKGWAPNPYDIYSFFLGGVLQSCPANTYFDARLCTCQHNYLLPSNYGYFNVVYEDDNDDYTY